MQKVFPICLGMALKDIADPEAHPTMPICHSFEEHGHVVCFNIINLSVLLNLLSYNSLYEISSDTGVIERGRQDT